MDLRAYSSVQQKVLFTVVLILALVMIYPLLWMISSSLKPESLIFRELGLIPSQITLENYIQGWKGFSGISFTTFFTNSFIIVAFAILGNLISCSMAAYAFARLQFDLKSLMFSIMFLSIMLPYHVVLIPQYVMFHNLGWVNTFLPLIVPKFLATDAFFIFLDGAISTPVCRVELDNAARVDGCGPVQIFIRIIFPLLTPALVTTSIFTFIWTWNDFFSQLIYISNPRLYPVSLALRVFLDATSDSWGSLFAMSILSLVPIFIFFVLFQRLLIEGIATTGLK